MHLELTEQYSRQKNLIRLIDIKRVAPATGGGTIIVLDGNPQEDFFCIEPYSYVSAEIKKQTEKNEQ